MACVMRWIQSIFANREASANPAMDTLPEPGQTRHLISWRTLQAFALWTVVFGLVLLVYSKALDRALIYDDVAMLLYFDPSRDFHWYDSFRPLDNGFYRPWYVLTYYGAWKIAGLNPLGYRLLAAGIHAAVAVMAGLTFCRLFGVGRLAGIAISLTVALASSAFVTVYYYSNTGDSMLALGMLTTIYCCDRWLSERRARWLAGLFTGLVFAMGCKETGVAVSGIVFLQVWSSTHRDRPAWLTAGAALLLGLTCAVAFYLLQKYNPNSYQSRGYAEDGMINTIRRVINYLAATIFPGSYVMRPFWSLDPETTKWIHRSLRGGTLITLAGAFAIVLIRRSRGDILKIAVLVLGAAGMLLPTSLVAMEAGPHSPIGRYLYSSMVLVILAAGGFALWLYQRNKLIWRAAAAIWVCWLIMQVLIIRKSPGTQDYYETSRQWRAIREEIGRLSPGWPPMHGISLYSGPEYGSFYIDSPYATSIMRLYYPKLLLAFVSNEIVPQTARAYTFDGRHFHERALPE